MIAGDTWKPALNVGINTSVDVQTVKSPGAQVITFLTKPLTMFDARLQNGPQNIFHKEQLAFDQNLSVKIIFLQQKMLSLYHHIFSSYHHIFSSY